MRRAGLLLSLAIFASAQAQDVPENAAVEQPRAALTAAKATQSRLLGVTAAGGRLTAVGQQGLILQSTDGKQWQQIASPASSMLNRVRFSDDKRGWIVGYDACILATVDGGQSWQLQHYDAAGRALHDVLFLDAQHGIAVGAYGTVLITRDGGAHWEVQASVLAELSLHLNTVLRLRDGGLLIAGEQGLLARSSDQGLNWQLVKSPYIGSWFGALPLGEKGSLLFGMRGNVFATQDVSSLTAETPASFDGMDRQSLTDPAAIAAAGWRQFENSVPESLFGGTLLTPERAALVGVNGVITQADLVQGSLQPMKRLKDEPLADVAVFENKLIVAGRRGVQNLGATP